MKVDQSRVLKKLRAGQLASCTKLNLYDSRVAEIAAMVDFDCVWVDMEHVPNDWSAIEKQVLACRARGADSLVRVARGSYSDHVRPLEMGASGIMVPHIMNLEDAKKVVHMTRFYPIGRRPVDGGNTDGGYCMVEFDEYLQGSNREKMLILQIEDPEPLADLDAIAALDGVDMLFFGPGDFSQGIGAPGDFEHPQLVAAQKAVAEAALRHGKFAGTVGSLQSAPKLKELGYSFISIGADVVGLVNYFSDIVAGFKTI